MCIISCNTRKNISIFSYHDWIVQQLISQNHFFPRILHIINITFMWFWNIWGLFKKYFSRNIYMINRTPEVYKKHDLLFTLMKHTNTRKTNNSLKNTGKYVLEPNTMCCKWRWWHQFSIYIYSLNISVVSSKFN